MIGKNSRYKDSLRFEGEGYRGLRAREPGKATGVVEHQLREGDRLDLLARHYYNDSRLWWRILDANPELGFGGDLTLDQTAWQQALETDPATAPQKITSKLVGKIILIPGARER